MTNFEILSKGEEMLKKSGIAEAKLDAFLLFEHIFVMPRTKYLMVMNDECQDEERILDYYDCISKRAEHIPLQHLTGHQEFMGFDFKVSPDVLIPRQDTETVVEEAIHEICDISKSKSTIKVLDMCTGSGCIGISIDKLVPATEVTCVDISDKALEIANLNKLHNESDVTLTQSDLFQNITDKYDLIISNPPYIPTKVIDGLMPEVKEHEPMLALDGMEDGLSFYEKITKAAVNYLNEGGRLVYEIGHNQGKEVSDMMIREGFVEVRVIDDLSGNNRCVKGKYVCLTN